MNPEIPKDLSGVPESMARPTPSPTPSPTPTPTPTSAPGAAPRPTSSSFEFNQPTIISFLYLSGFLFGITWLVAVILAYVWKDQPKAEWERSHYTYQIRTFWIGFLGSVVSFLLMIILIGFLTWAAVAVLVVVRSVLSLIQAQKQEPMPNPETWLA